MLAARHDLARVREAAAAQAAAKHPKVFWFFFQKKEQPELNISILLLLRNVIRCR